jgi:hypothetical protein
MRTKKEETALRSRVSGWLRSTGSDIKAALEDAEAHAEVLIGQMTGDSQDLALMGTRGHLASANRCLDALGALLADRVKRARMEFYRDSHDLHKTSLVQGIHQIGVVPTHQGAIVARDAAIHGRPIGAEVTIAITSAKNTLLMAIQEARSNLGKSQNPVAGWKSIARTRIEKKLEGWLSDSSHAIHDALLYALLLPEMRPKI